MFILRSNYSNNAIALLQWVHEQQLADVTVVYVDTGWAGEGWLDYVAMCEDLAKRFGFNVVHLEALAPFEDVMEMKGGFPNQQHQWCALHLKGIPFLKWVEAFDPATQATVLVPKCGADMDNVPEYIECCEYHGERRVWHPLFNHDLHQRDALIQRAGLTPMPHRSLECDPCINNTISDLRRLAESDIEKTAALEDELETSFFNPKDCGGAAGIRAVVEWAKSADDDALQFKYGCSADFGCGA